MSLTIINHKNHKIDNDLSLKLENAFNLIRKEENLGDCSVNLKIVDNEEIEIGNRIWKVRVGNGHAPEHATLWSNVDDIVLAGDQIISSISPNLGVYATEPNANPVKEWIDTCHKLSAFASDKHLTLSGHKLPFTGLKSD